MGRDLPTLWRASDVQAVAVRSLLAPLGLLYSLGWTAYVGVYRLGWKRAYRARVPVVCVGAATVGGAGKSPVSLAVARILLEMGRPVVMGLSGYGGPRSVAAQIAPDGPLVAREWGDEPAMVRDLMAKTPMVVGRDRVLAAKLVEEAFPDSVLVMDDGFQHLPLAKSVSIVLDDPDEPNRMCLPAGPYREPSWTLSRASTVLPGEFRVGVTPTRFRLAPEWSPVPPPALATAVLSVAKPERVLSSLTSCSIELHHVVTKPDHDRLDDARLLETLPKTMPIITTHKDWVKVRERPDHEQWTWMVVERDVWIAPDDAFRQWLQDRLMEANA